jgi:hypothetical protein
MAFLKFNFNFRSWIVKRRVALIMVFFSSSDVSMTVIKSNPPAPSNRGPKGRERNNSF